MTAAEALGHGRPIDPATALDGLDGWSSALHPEPELPVPDPGAVVWRDTVGPLVVSRTDKAIVLHQDRDLAVEVRVDRTILARHRLGLAPATIDHFLRDQVAPRVLAHDGRLVLHAGGIRVDDGAVLLIGTTGRGKSTLSASFDRAGWPLLGDDAMIVDTADTPRVRAVYPSLRLLPDSIAALFDRPVAQSPVAHYSAKQRIDLPDVAPVPPLPVRAIVVLDAPAGGNAISAAPVGHARSCAALIANSFALDPTDLGQAAARMAQAAALAAAVPAFALTYPRDFARLADVRAAILDQLSPAGED